MLTEIDRLRKWVTCLAWIAEAVRNEFEMHIERVHTYIRRTKNHQRPVGTGQDMKIPRIEHALHEKQLAFGTGVRKVY